MNVRFGSVANGKHWRPYSHSIVRPSKDKVMR
jgi:hypothetical protein